MPKNNKIIKHTITSGVWSCGHCIQEFYVKDNIKLYEMKIRLHQKICKKSKEMDTNTESQKKCINFGYGFNREKHLL